MGIGTSGSPILPLALGNFQALSFYSVSYSRALIAHLLCTRPCLQGLHWGTKQTQGPCPCGAHALDGDTIELLTTLLRAGEGWGMLLGVKVKVRDGDGMGESGGQRKCRCQWP